MKRTLRNMMSYILLITMLTLIFSAAAVNAAAADDGGDLKPVLTVTNLMKDGKGDYEIGTDGTIIYRIDVTNTGSQPQTNVVVKGGVPANTSLKLDAQTLLELGTSSLSTGVLDVNNSYLMLLGTRAGVNIKDIGQTELWDLLYAALNKYSSGLMSVRNFIAEPLLWNVGTIAAGATVSMTYVVHLNEGIGTGTLISNDMAVYSDTSIQVASNKANVVVPLNNGRVPLDGVTDTKNSSELELLSVTSLEYKNNGLTSSLNNAPMYASLNVNPFMITAYSNVNERSFNAAAVIAPSDSSVVEALNDITISRDIVMSANITADEEDAAGPEDDDIMSIFDTSSIAFDEIDNWESTNTDTDSVVDVTNSNSSVDPSLQIAPYANSDADVDADSNSSTTINQSSNFPANSGQDTVQANIQPVQQNSGSVNIAPDTGDDTVVMYILLMLSSIGAAVFMVVKNKRAKTASQPNPVEFVQ